MSTIDLTSFQSPSSQTVVRMPDGDEIVLRPLMGLGSEHDQMLMDTITAIGDLKIDDDGEDGAAKIPLGKLGEIMPLVGRLLAAAAPDKKAAARLDRLPMMARFQVLMGYIEDQDLGGLSPSEV